MDNPSVSLNSGKMYNCPEGFLHISKEKLVTEEVTVTINGTPRTITVHKLIENTYLGNCLICHNQLNDPVYRCSNRHLICRQCDLMWAKTKKELNQKASCCYCREQGDLIDDSCLAWTTYYPYASYLCLNQCGLLGSDKDQLKRHIIRCEPHTCFDCKKKLKTRTSRLEHRKECPEQEIRCELCKNPVRRRELSEHALSCPEVEESFFLASAKSFFTVKRKFAAALESNPKYSQADTTAATIALLQQLQLSPTFTATTVTIEQDSFPANILTDIKFSHPSKITEWKTKDASPVWVCMLAELDSFARRQRPITACTKPISLIHISIVKKRTGDGDHYGILPFILLSDDERMQPDATSPFILSIFGCSNGESRRLYSIQTNKLQIENSGNMTGQYTNFDNPEISSTIRELYHFFSKGYQGGKYIDIHGTDTEFRLFVSRPA